MEKYKVTVSVTQVDRTAKKVKHDVPASKKFQATLKALYQGYKIQLEGSFFIILTKKDNNRVITVGMFQQD